MAKFPIAVIALALAAPTSALADGLAAATEPPTPPLARPIGMFQVEVLAAVSRLGENAYPAELARYLSRVLGKHVSLAQVFVALERLEDRGMVSGREFFPEPTRGGRRRRIFQLEEPGARALRDLATAFDRASSSQGVIDQHGKEAAPA